MPRLPPGGAGRGLEGTPAANEFCLRCHSRSVTARRADGTTYTIRVDEAKLRASVHPDHACVDCHAGFSASAHPLAAGARHNHAVDSTRVCSGCHAEKLRQAEGSIHFTLLRSGVAGAPGCTDCHSAHAVAPKERYATLTGTPCRGCHEEMFMAYAGSMHGTALATESHLDAPLCSDRHRAHDVKGSASPDLVREACIGCHQAAGATHEAWLPPRSTFPPATAPSTRRCGRARTRTTTPPTAPSPTPPPATAALSSAGSRRWGTGGFWFAAQIDRGRDIGKPATDSSVVRAFYPTEDSDRFTMGLDAGRVAGFESVEVRAFVGRYRLVTDRDRAATASVTRRLQRADVGANDASFRVTGMRPFERGYLRAGVDFATRF